MGRKKIIDRNYTKLVLSSILVSLMSVFLAYTLKHLTEYFEQIVYHVVNSCNKLLFVILPSIGITAIYFLTKYLFQNRKNKGITEIYKTLDQRKEHLPFFKVPSHFFNGFLTVIFGGSTGIEVSTVVATATIGNTTCKKKFSARTYKTELICSGVAAGVSVLFVSPLAGCLFATEVIARKISKTVLISCVSSSLISWLFILFFEKETLLPFHIQTWYWYAIPFFIVLSLLGGLLSVYFTLLITRMKKLFSNINNNFLRVNIGACLVGILICFFPILYGDSYHGLREILINPTISATTLLFLILLKPIASSLTLGSGGDGGVFAPSIVGGVFLGVFFATICNTLFGTHLILLNFALVGAVATLSASIYAPFTALILICNLIPNGYQLFFPLLLGSFIAKYFSQVILPYNVYTYDFYFSKVNAK